MFIHTSSGGGGHELSGALLDMERAPSNIIWILFDYVFFRIERTNVCDELVQLFAFIKALFLIDLR